MARRVAYWGETWASTLSRNFPFLPANYSAEYGKTSGGVVNAITRSGNQFVFTAVCTNSYATVPLDARNFFEDPTVRKAPFKRNQFGGAIGGPIIKNHTFFFADYEGIRQSKGIARSRYCAFECRACRNREL